MHRAVTAIQLAKVCGLVIDMRGNGGGSDCESFTQQPSLLLVARPQVSLPARLLDRFVPRRQQLRVQMPRDVLVVVALLQDGGQPGDDLGVLRGEVDLLGRVGQDLTQNAAGSAATHRN